MAVHSINPRKNRGVILFGLGVGLLVAAGLTLAMLFWPLSIPAALVFVFSISPLVAWALSYASIVAIAAASVVMGVLATTAAKLLVTLYQGVAWGVRSFLNRVMSPEKEVVAKTGLIEAVNSDRLGSNLALPDQGEGEGLKTVFCGKNNHHDLFFANSSREVSRKEASDTAPRERAKSFPF